jgi:mannosyltransferase
MEAMTDRDPWISRVRDLLDRSSDLFSSYALPTAVGVLALVLRLYGLADKPFWLDEVTSLHRATMTVSHLVHDSFRRSHYPTYFLLLWLVARLGTSQWLLRLPSAVFGAVGAALVCRIGGKAAGPRSGAIAGLLMAFSPFAVQLGQEARSYTLVSCLILTGLLGLVGLAQQPDRAALPWRSPAAVRGPWLAYCLGTAAALVVLNVAIPWLLASNLSAIVIARRARPASGRFLRNWGLTQLFIFALWLPSLVEVYVGSKGGVLDGASWAPAETAATVWAIAAPIYLLRISSFVTLDLAPAAIPALSLLIMALAAIGLWRLRRDPAVFTTLALATLLLPLTLLLLSPRVPLLVPRYFAWGAGPFFILAGAGLGQLVLRRLLPLAGLLGAACLVNLAPYYGYETKPRWDLLAARLAAKAKPGDVVLLNNYYSYYVFSVFAAKNGLDARRVKLTWNLAEASRLAAGRTVWAVYGRTDQARMRPVETYRNSLAPLGRPAAEFSVGRYIVSWRYREPAALPASGAEATRPEACSTPCAVDQPHP